MIAVGLSERLVWFEAQFNDWLDDQVDKIEEQFKGQLPPAAQREHAEAIVRFVLWRVFFQRLDGYVQMGAWLEAPFPEHDETEEAHGG